MHQRTWVILYSAALVLGCGTGETDRASAPNVLDAALRDSGGIRVLELSRTPTELATTPSEEVVVVAPDLRVGDSDPWFGTATDVAALGGGRFAVLDGMEKRILIFDSLGNIEATYGREGGGPGEYEEPWALSAVAGRLVIWQNRPNSTFTVLGNGGSVVATGGAMVDGDWSRPMYRNPNASFHGAAPTGPEDVTRRLVAYGDADFLHMLQPNEFKDPNWAAPVSYASPPAHLIRYGMDAQVRDTVATLVGAATVADEVMGRETILYDQPLFSARPVFATGAGWLALGHGDSSEVVVRGFDGDTVLVVRWPDRRMAVEEADRIESMRFIVMYRAHRQPSVMELIRDLSPRQRREGLRVDAVENWEYAEVAPTLTAAYGAGSCLYLSGFSPTDWGDGTALTWVAINVEKGGLEAVLRLRQPEVEPFEVEEFWARGAAVRDFDRSHTYTTFRDSQGVYLVERYPLSEISCGDTE